jgi:GT2 family glycosyltransferase
MGAQRNSLAPARFLPIVVRGALSKAWTAFRENRLPFSPRWWLQALSLHWKETRASLEAIAPSAGLDRARFDASYQEWLLDDAHRAAGEGQGLHLSIAALIDEPAHLDGVIQSVIAQSFNDWDLSLIPLRWRPEYESILEGGPLDRRIRLISLDHLVSADGRWLPPGNGQTVVFLDSESLLAPGALARIARMALRQPDAWIYTDDDLLDGAGRRSDPNLKGAFSPELALVDDYATRLAVSPRRAVADAGGLRTAYGRAQIYELFLRVVDGGTHVEHLADVCCHRRALVAPVLTREHRQAANEALGRRGVPAEIVLEKTVERAVPRQRVKWRRGDLERGEVTIVIPTRDRVDLLRACLTGLRRTIDMSRVKVLIVDDQSRQPETLTFLADFERTAGCRVLRTAAISDTFNYSRLMNVAAREVDTPLMLHLNNDVEAIAPGWLEQMQGWLTLPGIGVVGPKLLYPDGSIQHAGVMVMPQLAPAHLFLRLPNHDSGYQWLPHRLRNVSAVTGACVLTHTALFHDVGGFDEEHLPVQFNDIEYCLRVMARGKRIVYEPAAVLRHRTSASRGDQFDYRENVYFMTKYRDLVDPYISPHVEPLSMMGHTPALKRRRVRQRRRALHQGSRPKPGAGFEGLPGQ